MPIKPTHKKRPWIKERKPYEDAPTNPFYWRKAWRKLRALHLVEQPLCQECKRNNVLTMADMVDHVRPINPVDPYDLQGGNYPHPLGKSNLQSLCNTCHAKKMSRASKLTKQ